MFLFYIHIYLNVYKLYIIIINKIMIVYTICEISLYLATEFFFSNSILCTMVRLKIDA